MKNIFSDQVILNGYITGRAGVFIDEANLFHSQKTLGWRIDYQKLHWVLRDLNLATRNIFVYSSFLRSSQKQKDFIDRLVEYGFVVHSKEVKEIRSALGTISRKGSLDIELAVDAYRFSNTYDTLILFSGDSDFAYLVDLLKETHKKIIVISARKNISYELMHRSHKYIDLRKLRSSIEKVDSDSLKATLADGLGGTTPYILSKTT